MKLINIYNKHLLSLKDHQLFNQFKDRETMYSFARSQIKSANIKNYLMTPGNLSYIFNFVRENNYDLFVDFYEYFGEEVK